MQNPRLARRYAKAVIDLALERGELEKVYQDMQLLKQICRQNRDFLNMLRSPIISAGKKQQIFHAIFKDKVSVITEKFCVLLFQKQREMYLPEIIEAAIDIYRNIKNIRKVKLTTAVKLDDSMKEAIKRKIATEMPGEQIEMNTAVNDKLIGGFILQTEDKLFDASILHDLQDVKKQFMKNVYIQNIR